MRIEDDKDFIKEQSANDMCSANKEFSHKLQATSLLKYTAQTHTGLFRICSAHMIPTEMKRQLPIAAFYW